MSEIALAWLSQIPAKDLTHAEYRVLTRLCWLHDAEKGYAWPGYTHLMETTGISRGGLNKCLTSLEEKGLLTRHKMDTDSTRYDLHTGVHSVNRGVHSVNRGCSLSEPNKEHIISNELEHTPYNPPEKRSDVVEVLCQVSSPEAAKSFTTFRSKIKKPLTVTAAKRIVAQLQIIEARGGCADDALGMCEEKGWQSIKADWYFNAKGDGNDRSEQKAASLNQLHLDVAARLEDRYANEGR